MMLTEKEFYAHDLHYGTLKEAAHNHRLRHAILGETSDLPRPCCLALYWLGCRLMAMGARLQHKFSYYVDPVDQDERAWPLQTGHSL